MQTGAETINPWLMAYIEQNYQTLSRYEIDRDLLNSGYDASQIEVAWNQAHLNEREAALSRQQALENKLSRPQLMVTRVGLGCLHLFLVAAGLFHLIPLRLYIFYPVEHSLSLFLIVLGLLIVVLKLLRWLIFSRRIKRSKLISCLWYSLIFSIFIFGGSFCIKKDYTIVDQISNSDHLYYLRSPVITLQEIYECDKSGIFCTLTEVRDLAPPPLDYPRNSNWNSPNNYQFTLDPATGKVSVTLKSKT